jgi:hypothetical protein
MLRAKPAAYGEDVGRNIGVPELDIVARAVPQIPGVVQKVVDLIWLVRVEPQRVERKVHPA